MSNYYTKAEIDNLLLGKAPSNHVHAFSVYSHPAGDPPHQHLVEGDLTGDFYTSQSERESHQRGKRAMSIQKYKPEQIVTVLRQIEVQMANEKTAPQACPEAGIHTQFVASIRNA